MVQAAAGQRVDLLAALGERRRLEHPPHEEAERTLGVVLQRRGRQRVLGAARKPRLQPGHAGSGDRLPMNGPASASSSAGGGAAARAANQRLRICSMTTRERRRAARWQSRSVKAPSSAAAQSRTRGASAKKRGAGSSAGAATLSCGLRRRCSAARAHSSAGCRAWSGHGTSGTRQRGGSGRAAARSTDRTSGERSSGRPSSSESGHDRWAARLCASASAKSSGVRSPSCWASGHTGASHRRFHARRASSSSTASSAVRCGSSPSTRPVMNSAAHGCPKLRKLADEDAGSRRA